jgi:hypothetical protein
MIEKKKCILCAGKCRMKAAQWIEAGRNHERLVLMVSWYGSVRGAGTEHKIII